MCEIVGFVIARGVNPEAISTSYLQSHGSLLSPIVDNLLFFPDFTLSFDCNSLSVNNFFCDAIGYHLVDRVLINVEGVNRR